MANSDYEYEFEEVHHGQFFHSQDEYEESDSYEYPWSTSSDDSYKDLSSDEAIQKIIDTLPTYSSESSGDERLIPILYESASDSDAGSFIEREENDNDDDDKKEFYQPETFLNSVETYNIYIVPHSSDESDGDEDDIETPVPANSNDPTPQTNMDKVAEMISDNDTEQQTNEPALTTNDSNQRSSLIIQPTQSQIPILNENAATEIDEIKSDSPPKTVRYLLCLYVITVPG